MDQSDLIPIVVEALESAGAEYFITGSVAAMHYSGPRLTQDVDVVISVTHRELELFLAKFPEPTYYWSRDAVRAAMEHASQFNIIQPEAGRIDIYVMGHKPYDEARLSRARRREVVPGVMAMVAAPEDVILKKLQFFRESGHERHIRDIAGMIEESGSILDNDYLRRWAGRLGVDDLWAHIREARRPPNPLRD